MKYRIFKFQRITISPTDRKSGIPFCAFTNRCRIDGKNHTTVTDLNLKNFVNLYFSFIFHQSLIKICRLFPNYSVIYENPYFMHLLQGMWSFFGQVPKQSLVGTCFSHLLADKQIRVVHNNIVYMV